MRTEYVYDALNRVTNRNYSTPNGTPGTGLLANYQATPNATYTYDNLPNAKGKLTKVSSSVSTTEYTAFNILGRVTAAKQTTDAQYDDDQNTRRLRSCAVFYVFASFALQPLEFFAVVEKIFEGRHDIDLTPKLAAAPRRFLRAGLRLSLGKR